eukprot:363880-Chlamydomonas_euryale.AAC.2
MAGAGRGSRERRASHHQCEAWMGANQPRVDFSDCETAGVTGVVQLASVTVGLRICCLPLFS